MTLAKTLLELKKLMTKWGLTIDDWSLFLHFADRLCGYNIPYDRNKHLHVLINSAKFPWKINKSNIGYEVVIPFNSKYDKDFRQFIKKTGYDFHIAVSPPKFFNKFKCNLSTSYKIGKDKIRIAKPEGTMKFERDVYLPKIRGKLSPEVFVRRFVYEEDIYVEAKKRNDQAVTKIIREILKKYKPKNQALSKSRDDALNRFNKYKLINGEIGYEGNVNGKVFLINNPDQPPKIKKGFILVSKLTSPRLTPYLKASKAVITDEGGILSHAAIISRELKIPCVVGTKIATKVLRDGDLVEVDANKGIVKKIN